MDINKLLCEVLSICHQISVKSNADVFFNYAPHCDSYSIDYHYSGWKENRDNKEWIAMCRDITEENLEESIEKLRALAEKKGVELRA